MVKIMKAFGLEFYGCLVGTSGSVEARQRKVSATCCSRGLFPQDLHRFDLFFSVARILEYHLHPDLENALLDSDVDSD
jgi:hypothetical protein